MRVSGSRLRPAECIWRSRGCQVRFVDAAAVVLGKENRPMKAEEIAEKAITSGLIHTRGKTPGATMYVAIWEEIQRTAGRSRFVKAGPNLFALSIHQREQALVESNLQGKQRFTIGGNTFQLSGEEVLEVARGALMQGQVDGASDFRRWCVSVDDHKVSVKWLLAVATGLPPSAFTSAHARSILSRLGLEPQRVDAPTVKIQQAPAEQDELSRRDFFENVIAALRRDLRESLQGFRHRVWENSNVAQVYYSESSIHYELRLLKRGPRAEIGLHFETSQSRNLKLLEHFYPVVGDLEQQLGAPVHAEPWGKYWARVYLVQPGQPLTAAWATEIAKQWAQFISTTYPTLARALEDVPGRGARPPKPRQREVERWQTIAAERVSAIRAFLDGASGHMPSDETLCSWIEFCYTFELFREGAALFERVSEEAVNEWLYKRTKKIAMGCRHRMA